jgi:hypothetical protein
MLPITIIIAIDTLFWDAPIALFTLAQMRVSALSEHIPRTARRNGARC